MQETIQDLKTRRSCRGYKEEQISEEQLNQILEAGTYAPTGMGMQSPIMVVVQDKETIALADKNRPTCLEDGSLVMGNLMNAAHAVGVDSCWIHRAKEEFESEEGKALLEKWGIKGDYVGIGHCVLGYAKDAPAPAKPRKENYIYRV